MKQGPLQYDELYSLESLDLKCIHIYEYDYKW